MKIRRTLGLSALLAALVLASPAQALPDIEGPAAVTFDVLLLRPLGALRTLIGGAMFVPAAIVTSPGGRTAWSEAWRVFVQGSADDLLNRPLGDF